MRIAWRAIAIPVALLLYSRASCQRTEAEVRNVCCESEPELLPDLYLVGRR